MAYPVLSDTATYFVKEQLDPSRKTSVGVSSSNNSLVYRYTRKDNAEIDPDDVIINALIQAPFYSAHPFFLNFTLKNATVDVVSDTNLAVDVTLSYDPSTPDNGGGSDVNGEVWDFGANASPRKITTVDKSEQLTWRRDLQNVGNMPAPNPDNIFDTVGADLKGNAPEGVDLYRPTGSLRVSKNFDFTSFTQVQRNIIYELQGKVNDAVFAGFAKGEILFLGAQMTYNYDTETVAVAYNFIFGSVSPAITVALWNGLKIRSTAFTDVQVKDADNEIKPFDYVWKQSSEQQLFESNDPAQGSNTVAVTESVSLLKNPSCSFAALGLGSGPA